MWFSPNGDKLAFASFNDLHVNVMTIAYYGEPGAVASQYPEMLYLRYPKASINYFSFGENFTSPMAMKVSTFDK